MVMIDQYKQETSQIHAPADLIRRTKEAMHEEELRLQRKADRPFVPRYGKIYKWALPAAGAAAVLFVISAASVMVGSRLGKSSSDTAMESAMDNGAAYEMAAAAEEPAEYEAADLAPAEQESAAGAMADDYALSEDVAEAGEEDGMQKGTVNDAANGDMEAGTGSTALADLSVMKVTEIPAFVDDADTLCVMVHGIRVYVAKETDHLWSAYMRIGQVDYTVTGGGNIMDAEDFAAEAYTLIVETVENE